MAVRVKDMGRGPGPAELLRRQPALRLTLTGAGFFLLGASTAAGRLFSGAGPFGMAAVAAAGFGLRGLA